MTVLALAEHRRGELRDVSFEAVGAAVDAAGADEPVHAVVVGGATEDYADQLTREGVETVHAVAAGSGYNHDETVAGAAAVARAVDARLVLAPHSANGLDTIPALASTLDRPLVTDAVAIDDADPLVVTRELYGSKLETTIEVDADAAVVTIRPGEWGAPAPGGDATVESFGGDVDADVRTDVTGYDVVSAGDVDITEADVLVSVGRGIDEEDNLEIIHDLADAMGATVSASRPIIDNGWLPANRQVGQSGKVVTPDVYLAIGISGAVQHVAGMKGADTIIAINEDPNAPIFDIADYGIVDDLFDVVPALTEEFGG